MSRNYDTLLTMGEADRLREFVTSTFNKIPQVRPDIVPTDENWENWDMEALIHKLRQWLKRHKVDDTSEESGGVQPKREKHWYNKEKGDPVFIFCEGKHWGDASEVINTIGARRQFFQEKKLCFNCGRVGHRGKQCRSRGCFRCKSKHHTSLCDKDKNRPPASDKGTVLTSYSPSANEWSLPAITPVKIKGETFWAYLDTGAERISLQAKRPKG